ncbi:FMN-linked oxidoreductase [Zopfia rhizophila CBS 207.26]|uniref:FMN-linked oxidoreductase n=1 Tax=Zopfia rhizophila CBS 207.26 TaxID=1314779 RepID=A0A6A6DPU5_9PEZI|nr:FMN-linked oxidoreductase [Zopfia rhizophila CBS 207.26]
MEETVGYSMPVSMPEPEAKPERYHSEPADRSRLAEPLTFAFSGRTAPNRFMKAAMTEQLCTFDFHHPEDNGIPTKNIERCYERWSRGGIGLILSGNVMVFPTQLESMGDPVIPRDAPVSGPRFNGFAAVARAGKAHGSLMVAQVSHPGRLCVFQESPVSASDVAVANDGKGDGIYKYKPPHPATQEEIREIIDAFAHAAEYLAKAGWDGIELHGAHGFLLAQFLSPKTNKRTDEYGGSLENRMRFVLEIGREIRKRTPPNFILGIKINSTEFQDTGFLTSEARELCRQLENNRFDFVELSGGSYEKVIMTHIRESTKKREAFFLEFADQIVPGLTKTKVYVTGGLRTVGGMVRALDTVDGVGLGRPLCEEWHLCKDILEGKVDGSIVTGIDPGDFWLFLMAGNRQMRLVGMGAEPAQLWRKEVVDKLKAEYKDWAANKSTEKELQRYRAIDAAYIPQGKL